MSGQVELDCHPHVPEERAELFHTADGGSTEYEYLNLLHALVLATKPRLVLETGTFRGLGSLALASAIHWNGVGRLITVDASESSEAKDLLSKYSLSEYVEFVQSESVQFCAEWAGDQFDFLFFDSDVNVRARECDLLLIRKKIVPGAVAAFHDSSDLRHGASWSWEMIQYLRGLPGGLTLKGSRGLRLVQF